MSSNARSLQLLRFPRWWLVSVLVLMAAFLPGLVAISCAWFGFRSAYNELFAWGSRDPDYVGSAQRSAIRAGLADLVHADSFGESFGLALIEGPAAAGPPNTGYRGAWVSAGWPFQCMHGGELYLSPWSYGHGDFPDRVSEGALFVPAGSHWGSPPPRAMIPIRIMPLRYTLDFLASIAAFAVPCALLSLARLWLRHRRSARGRCPRCGYPSLGQPRCPECGHLISATAAKAA